MFLTRGYGATSIEALARHLRMSKRTFYHRFHDKAALFEAVVHRVVERLRPVDIDPLFEGRDAAEILIHVATMMLRAALSPQAIALQRLVVAEATKFPELAAIVTGEGSRRQAVEALARMLRRHFPVLTPAEASFTAEQFVALVIALPQRRALGLGAPLSEEETVAWVRDSVRLFLVGCQGWREAAVHDEGRS